MDSIDYYERYASVYFENTVDVSMEGILDEFLKYLPENAEVLDLGCGSGRDGLYLDEAGCYVTFMDGSKEMCELAEIHTGKEVLNLTFEELDFQEVFDGIWACASLLHVEEKDMDRVMKKVMAALKPQGVLYASFRYGDSEEIRNQRYFCDYTEEKLTEMMGRQENAKILEMWISEDARGNNQKQWINIIVRNDILLKEERDHE